MHTGTANESELPLHVIEENMVKQLEWCSKATAEASGRMPFQKLRARVVAAELAESQPRAEVYSQG